MQSAFSIIEGGGVTSPKGYRASALLAGIKPSRKRDDMALIVSERPAAAAGLFTTNRIVAAPVRLCQRHLSDGATARAIIINAGNANACTGAQGMADAEKTASILAENLKIPREQVLVCSTGTIGIPLPMEKIETAIPKLVATVRQDAGVLVANAIMTTDTVPKHCAVSLDIDGRNVTIGGMAKGAGMIEPHMATMLAFVTTDASIDPLSLRLALKTAVDNSFNRITIDGDQSTNDTILCIANGVAGNRTLSPDHPQWNSFCTALSHIAQDLAFRIVRDGEGATKFVAVTVQGALSDDDAEKAARTISRSLLVKTSWFGGDPNWGRVMDAVGYSGAEVQENHVEIRYNNLVAVSQGRAASGTALRDLEHILKLKEFTLIVDLHLGSCSCTIYTCDCSEAYVRINSEYMT